MTQGFMLTQKTISTFQAQVELFEQCLNCANARHEVSAELAEIANTRGISQDELRQEISQLKEKLHKLFRLLDKISETANKGELSALLYFVKSVFLLKEILEADWDFFLGKDEREAIKNLTSGSLVIYKEIKNAVSSETPKKDGNYVALETLKHGLKSMIEAGLRVNAFSQEEVNAFDVGDITPQESETVLIFLSTMKKWEPVYKRLAAS
jgi:soluble cytochrome b562